MVNIFEVSDVFTPSSPAKLTFVERESINKKIVRALKTKGMQIIIYGPSGSGKTTLIENKLFQTYDNHIKTSCMKGMSYNEVLIDAFDQLKIFYLSEGTSTATSTVDINLKSSFQVIESQLKVTNSSSESHKATRLLPPQLTAQNLARFMGTAGYCWILDDFHKIDEAHKQELSQLMKVFMDKSIDFPELKIVCVGAVNTARQVVQYDKEMKGRVAEIKVPLMEHTEISKIITKGFELINIEICSNKIIDDIHHYSNGLASICHKLCSLICEGMGVDRTVTDSSLQNKDSIWIKNPENIGKDNFQDSNQMIEIAKLQSRPYIHNSHSGDKVTFEHLTYAINEFLDDSSDTIKQAFERAFKNKHASYILEALTECDEEGESIEEISNIINSMGHDFSADELKSLLSRLICENEGGIITCNENSSLYSFSSPFLMTFARNLFEQCEYKQRMSQGELYQMMNSALNTMKREFA